MEIRILFIWMICFSQVSYGATFYCDPVNGDISHSGSFDQPLPALDQVIANGLIRSFKNSPLPYDSANNTLLEFNTSGIIQGGDTIVLREGYHGSIFIQNYNNALPIVIKSYPGEIAHCSDINFQASSNWVVDGLTVSTYPDYMWNGQALIFIETHGWQGPCKKIDIYNCHLSCGPEPWTTAEDWITHSKNGIRVDGDSMKMVGNHIENIDMGITLSGNYLEAIGNYINNFSGDGLRMLGSNQKMIGNIVKNCYNVDDNHDDGIQSFNLGDGFFENNTIIGNLIINSDDWDRPLNGALQGIGCFDGFYKNWLIANNIVHVNHWHGISLYGAIDVHIINNTVIDPTPQVTPGGSWIKITDHKNGEPSENCYVINNVCNQVSADAEQHHNVELTTVDEYAQHFMDISNYDFHLLPSSSLIDAADANWSPEFDFDSIPRAMEGNGPDIGALEYLLPKTNYSVTNESQLVYPNPYVDQFFIKNIHQDDPIQIWSMDGRLLFQGTWQEWENNAMELASNSYIIRWTSSGNLYQQVMIKGHQ